MNSADISEHRLGVAKQMGATYTVHVDSKDSKAVAERVTSTMGGMADVTIECTGVESSMQTAVYVSRAVGCNEEDTFIQPESLFCLQSIHVHIIL